MIKNDKHNKTIALFNHRIQLSSVDDTSVCVYCGDKFSGMLLDQMKYASQKVTTLIANEHQCRSVKR